MSKMSYNWYITLVGILSLISSTLAEKRILGGQAASLGQYPMVAQILRADCKTHVCGGVIITHHVILTAAHCFPCRDLNVCIKDRKILVGDVNLLEIAYKPDSRQILSIELVNIHEKYDHNEHDYDLAAIKTKWGIRFCDNVKPARLSRWRPTIGKECDVCGWGMKENSVYPARLLCTKVSILEPEICEENLTYINEEQMLCAGDPEAGKGTCHKDSGGPLLCGGYLCGIVNYGKVLCNGIAAYADVSYHVPWIIEKSVVSLKSSKSKIESDFLKMRHVLLILGILFL